MTDREADRCYKAIQEAVLGWPAGRRFTVLQVPRPTQRPGGVVTFALQELVESGQVVITGERQDRSLLLRDRHPRVRRRLRVRVYERTSRVVEAEERAAS